MTNKDFSEKFSEFMDLQAKDAIAISPYEDEFVTSPWGKELNATVRTNVDSIIEFVDKHNMFYCDCKYNINSYDRLVLKVINEKYWEATVIYSDGVVFPLAGENRYLWSFNGAECISEEKIGKKNTSENKMDTIVAKPLTVDYFGNKEANKFYQEFIDSNNTGNADGIKNYSKSFSYEMGVDGKLHMKRDINGSVKELVIDMGDNK